MVDLPEAAGPSIAMMEGVFSDTNFTTLQAIVEWILTEFDSHQ